MSRIAINGFGRIGRTVYRIVSDRKDIEVAVINDLFDNDQLAYLLKYDTVMGVFEKEVRVDGEAMTVDGRRVLMTEEKDPAKLPWGELGVDVVVEATGKLVTREKLQKHLDAGAKKGHPDGAAEGRDRRDDRHGRQRRHAAQGAPHRLERLVHDELPRAAREDPRRGLRHRGRLHDDRARLHERPAPRGRAHKDLRRSRAAAENIIPTTTGAARAVGKVLPRLKGKLDGMAMRVPVPDGSVVDLALRLLKKPSVEDVNAAVRAAAEGRWRGSSSTARCRSSRPTSSATRHSSIFDALSTAAGDGYLKVLAWYDNEWGYSNRVVDLVDRLVAGLISSKARSARSAVSVADVRVREVCGWTKARGAHKHSMRSEARDDILRGRPYSL